MVKQRDQKLTLASFVSTFLVLAVLVMNLLSVVACSNGSTTQKTTTTPQTTPHPPNPNHLQSSYLAPDWWKPCIPSKVVAMVINKAFRQVCTAWNQSQPAAQCDSINYQKFAETTAIPLTSWRGFDVCGPRPDWVSTSDHYTEFSSGGSVEQEFECTELVKRYLLLAFGLPSIGGTNGDGIVDAYTGIQNSPFHKVINDAAHNGQFHMFPVEGDVLSYSTVHTSIVTSVTDMNSKGEGSATIHVIEQNRSSAGEEKLTMSNWIIDNKVSSWMTTRPVTPSTPIPTPSPTATPTPTPTPSPSPTPQPKLITVNVSATQGWQDSGVFVHAGDQLTIRYISGLWTSTAGSIAPFDGAGRPDGYTCTNSLPASQCVEPVPDAPQGALVAMVGTQLLKIGDYLKFNPTQGGTLYLRMNDADVGLYDNQGSITVQIEVS